MMEAKKSNIINEVFQMIRDASTTENARAIQDSESNVAIEQKHMIHCLAHKGWSRNEIVGEMQRIWGQDVLILPENLLDNRPFYQKFGYRFFSVFFMAAVVSPILVRRSVQYRSSGRMTKAQKDAIKSKLKL